MEACIEETIVKTGKFTFTSKYSTLSSYSELTLESTRSISEMIRSGADIEAEAYIKYGRTKEDYLNDLNNGVKIVVFTSPTGDLIYLPETEVSDIPDITMVPYGKLTLRIALGLQYLNVEGSNLELFNDKVVELAKSMIGVVPYTKYERTSATKWLNSTEHAIMQGSFNNTMSLNAIEDPTILRNIINAQAKTIADLECVLAGG